MFGLATQGVRITREVIKTGSRDSIVNLVLEDGLEACRRQQQLGDRAVSVDYRSPDPRQRSAPRVFHAVACAISRTSSHRILTSIGAGEPGLPGISIGHNGTIAFGLTIFNIDQEDLYVYELNPANPNEYKYQRPMGADDGSA